MADVKHKVERAAFGAAIDGILKYVNKDEEDREKAFLKLVDLSEGKLRCGETYDPGTGQQMDAVCEPYLK